jgi:fermentation-respiration switch protein FrsA (DUF1100 family)
MGEEKIASGDQSGQAGRPRPRWWRQALRLLARVVLAYLVILGFMMILEEKLIFFPSRYPEGDWHPAGLDFEDVAFSAADEVRLHGWFCQVEEPSAVVMVSHGNAGHLADRALEVQLWQRRLGVSVFIYDYRGYGRSQGSPNEAGLYNDARGAYRWLTETKRVPASQVVLRGESIGSAVSLRLAVEVPCRALIMESPFTSAVEVGERTFPWLPIRLMLRNRFDSEAIIGQYHGPLLITHGDRDTIIPFDMGKRLFELANQPKWFYAVPGADHNDVPFTGGQAYFQALRDFLDQTAPR